MSEPSSKKPLDSGHERRDINVRAVTGVAVGLTICVFIIFVAVRGMLRMFDKHSTRGINSLQFAEQTGLPPQPRLQSNPAEDLAHFREQQDALLNSYGWIDRKAGIVQIPIDQAMDIIAQRGLPKSPSDSIGKTPLQLRQSKGVSGKVLP